MYNLLISRNRELDIESVFKNVQGDFQKLTSLALSEKMKPEYRSSLGQAMYLGANLRHSFQLFHVKILKCCIIIITIIKDQVFEILDSNKV